MARIVAESVMTPGQTSLHSGPFTADSPYSTLDDGHLDSGNAAAPRARDPTNLPRASHATDAHDAEISLLTISLSAKHICSSYERGRSRGPCASSSESNTRQRLAILSAWHF